MTDEQQEALRRLAALRQVSQAAVFRDALDTILDHVHKLAVARGMGVAAFMPWIKKSLITIFVIFGTLITWIFLGETLSLQQILGMLLTLGGIGGVVSGQRDARMGDSPNKITNSALLFGLLAALGQAVSMVFSKLGMAGGIHPFAGNEIRMFSALVFLWGSALIRGQAGSTLKATAGNPKAMRLSPIHISEPTRPY